MQGPLGPLCTGAQPYKLYFGVVYFGLDFVFNQIGLPAGTIFHVVDQGQTN